MKTPSAALAGLIVIAVASLATPRSAVAQAPPGADTISLRAVAESLKVLDQLSKAVKANPKDTAAWYHRAMVAFVLGERADQKDKVPGLDYRTLRMMAGDSFLAARNLDPDNTLYKTYASHFALTDHSPAGRASGRPRTCDANLDHYATERDSALRLMRLVDMGWICWLDYDGYEGRGLSALGGQYDKLSIPGLSGPKGIASAASNLLKLSATSCGSSIPIGAIMEEALDSIEATLAPVSFDVAGEGDYLRGKRLFEAAHDLAPADERAYHSLAMLLAARNNWVDLQRLAQQQTRLVPGDAWGWMTLALATYRANPTKESGALFADAFARLDPADRDRLDRLERVLRPSDSAKFHLEGKDSRASIAQTSWLLADPLWSAPHADPHTEFLARVTYAELRWTLDGWHTHGADTDRGDVYIRYGPPNKVVGWVPPESDSLTKVGTMYTFWIYNAHLAFSFDKHLHTGTASTPVVCDDEINDRVKAWQPARWDNIATTRIDSMPTQVARFRADNDMVDVYLATQAPVKSMRELVSMNGDVAAHLWLLPRGPGEQFIDSVRVGDSGALQWTRRVKPGPYYYRVESMIPGTMVAARTAATMQMGADSATGFRLVGFGLSDVLLATRATSRIPPHRWNDLDVTPILGDIAKGSTISLVWENYELGRQNASARYDVTVAIERERSKGGEIGARIIGAIGGAAGISATKDKVTMKFERTVPFAPVITENIEVALGKTPSGSYRLTVQIADKVSGRVASRVSRIVIRD